MKTEFKNFVFSGGGILGIAYLGLLASMYERNLMSQIKRVAGTSAGAITACITSFNLTYEETVEIIDTLDYTQIPGKDEILIPRFFTRPLKEKLNSIFGNIDCLYRLVKNFGWYSSSYFYNWIKSQIALQFDSTKKAPPYTFLDFNTPFIHKDERPFKDLYIIGTDVNNNTSSIFSYDSTPNMEVAEAIRISMSIPIFFEAIKSSCENGSPYASPRIYSDGGLMYNYPINLFDSEDPVTYTVGSIFRGAQTSKSINNFIDFITNILSCTSIIQSHFYSSDPTTTMRSIEINTFDVSSMNFNVKKGDETYNFLYKQGYNAAERYFSNL